MKYIAITALILAQFWAAGAEYTGWSRGIDWEVHHEVMVKAFEASARASYTVEIKNPDSWDPEITLGRFYRRVEDDGFALLRVDLYKGDTLDSTFIRNREGQFGIDRHFTARLSEVSILFALEHTYAGFFEYEEQSGRLEPSEGDYRGRPCIRMIMTSPNSERHAGWLAWTALDDRSTPRSTFFRIRAFTREFLIDQETFVIYSRKHYNAFGRLIYQQTLGEVISFGKPDLALFATPENINLETLYRYDMRRMAPRPEAPKIAPLQGPGWGERIGRRWERFVMWIGSPAVIDGFALGLFIFALALLGVVFVYKRRYRRLLREESARERRRRR